jgi:hypothetical protein
MDNDDFREIIEKNKIINNNYISLNTNIINISIDIKKLKNIHQKYISIEYLETTNYSTYVDDIKHQIVLLQCEYTYIDSMYQLNLNKFYRDLFKLYNKITKNLLNIYYDNKEIIIKIWNSNDKVISESNDYKKIKKNIKNISDACRTAGLSASDNKIFEEIKKKFYSQIKIYSEINDNSYTIDDSKIIFTELCNRMNDLHLSKELIKINLIDIENKTSKGILGQTFIMDLNGKLDRINVDYTILIKLILSIMNIHINLTKRITSFSEIIANEVLYDELSEDISSNIISN